MSALRVFEEYFPFNILSHIEKLYPLLVGVVYFPYVQIKFHDFNGDQRIMCSEAYSAIESYLSSKTSIQFQAKRLRGDVKKNQSFVLSMDDNEEIADEFEGVQVWWASGKDVPKIPTFSYFGFNDEKRYYKLTFHRRQRDLILGKYLNHVLKEGKATIVRSRQRKLYTNNGARWSHVLFEHPATFQTLAMDPQKKQDIIDDLIAFSKGEEFYASIGRAWKRGYLLYGPPGTGKSTMIAAMANLLGYDLYDLELTAVKDNTELRKLLIETSSKSIIVIEDIDCSLDLTGQRSNTKDKGKEAKKSTNGGREKQVGQEEKEGTPSQVTLSGLLNFIDGLWSACRGERLIVFTTNYVEKLDAALIRKGRMDKHIELSYCNFESFKALARNYLKIESHHLFPTIQRLLGGANMVPADVVEHLMPKKFSGDAEICLKSLIQALKKEKAENGRLKTEEEKKEQGNHQLKRKKMSMAQDHLMKNKRRLRK